MGSPLTPQFLIPSRGTPAGTARASTVQTVSNSAAELKAGGSRLAERTRMIVVAIDQPIMVYPTNAVSTTLGIYVGAGVSLELDCAADQAWYAIRYGGTDAAVSVYEVAGG